MKPLALLAAAAALTAIVTASRGRLTAFPRNDAMVRVAWSARPSRVEICQRVSDEALAKLPEHMRRRLVCEGTTARYQLDVAVNTVRIGLDTVRGGGLRHDRELYVLREIAVTPGPTRVSVQFVQLDSSTADASDDRTDAPVDSSARPAARFGGEADERRRQRAQAVPAQLALDTVLTMAPRTVVLITYDELQRKLVAVSKPRS